ncbi:MULTISPECIES: pitrilysin family protein [unclassified Lysobacter]|uniref:M16 family metallopeptidase n=1 Tax=unclassified Lysobacter TaxID=2635362 RepID=UPI0006FB083D|nr:MULTISPECIES: pitrilysin family protein [unclassified Lysobacter]KRC31191.1 peptidase M16 [Lysobacter sp. Root76]KRD65683.1 peptidase M16 [Lysobacter sp. Root96]
MRSSSLLSFRPSSPRPLLSTLALALCLALPVQAAEPAVALTKGVDAGPCVEGICEYSLRNGLRVLLFPDASKPTVTVNLTYQVGSMHENYGETGMAHLLEHLLFKGTPTHSDITAEMKKRGVGFNGTTSSDRTNYYAAFPANDDTLRWLIGLEADRMVNSNIARKDLDSEMTVVRNEMEENENSPIAVLSQRVRSTAYLWHNYGHNTIGARSDVEGVPIDRLQAFYKSWYRPDNATLIVAGRIDPAKTLAAIDAAFSPIARPKTAMRPLYTVDPTQDGERSVVVRRSGDIQLLLAAYHVPAETHPDSAALGLLADILGYVPGGRLHKALVETKLAAGIDSGADSLRDPGLMTAVAGLPRDGDAAKAEAALLAQLENIAATPITQTELDAAKQRIRNGYELGYTNVNAVALGLSEAIAAGDWRLYFLRRDAFERVGLDDVNRVARAYLKPSNRTLGRFVPTDAADRTEIGTAPTAASLVQGYTGKAAIAAGEQFDASPANIQARTETFTLGDGLKVSLLPKKTRGGTVVVNARFRFGDLASLQGRTAAGSVAGALLMRGAAGLSREQIDQRFEALKTEVGVGGGLQAAGIGMTTRREQLAEALTLAAQVLRKPDYPQSEFEQLRLQSITGLEAARKEPDTVADMALAQYFDPWPEGHPLRWRSIDQSIADLKALKVEDLRAFHRDFYGSADGEISVVGDFDPVALKAQLKTLFAEWRTPHPFVAIDTHYRPVAARRERFETPDKANGVLLARTNVSLNDRDPDYPALLVANYILGGGGQSRLTDRIRQKDGLSYGVSSSLDSDSSREGRDDAGSLLIRAIAAPQNLDKTEAAMREEYARWISDGVGADELRDAVSGLLTQREQSRASDGAVAGLLSSNLFLGRTMQYSADVDAKIEALTVEEVNAAIRKHFKPEDLSVYLAGDFAKTAPAAAKPSAASAGGAAGKP